MTTACSTRQRARRLARALAPTLLALQAAWLPAGTAQAQPQALAPAIDAQVARHDPGLERLYQDLHAHPELGFQEVQTAAKLAAAMRAAGFTVSITPGGDATVNDARLVERAESMLKAAFGAQVKRMPPITPSEDFAEFGSAGVPSMFFLVGVLDPKDVEAARAPGGKPVPGNHSPLFAPVPEPSIKTAVKAMSLAVLSALQR